MITVKPTSGFGNRLRVIDSALSMAKSLNQPLCVIWERSFDLNCGFYKIFSKNNEFTVIEKTSGPLKTRIMKKLPDVLDKIRIKYPFSYDVVLHNNEIERIKKSGNDFSFCRSAKEIYIQSCHHFFTEESSFSWFKPTDEISKTVSKYTSAFSQNTIGLHIRRADNIRSVKHSPLNEFIRMMNIEIEKDNNCRFFLATDSISEEKILKDKFGARIISHPKILDRDKEQGIIDAVVDLCCLASTRKIIGSHFSSFSEVAAQLKNIELFQVYAG